MNDVRRTNRLQCHRCGRRRGAAMLLVLISLATATILTMAYVSSRDNSIEIGNNVADSATARWSALSGLELGVSVLETETDWRTNHTNGLILDDHPIGDALVDLLAEDLETNAPPTESTTDVRLTSIASVSGVTQTASATVHVNATGGGVDVDLSEFSVFTSGPIALRDDAMITRWPTAPASKMGKRVAIGTQSLVSGSVMLENNSAAIDASVYLGDGASGTAVINSSSDGLTTKGVLGNIPLPDAPAPGVQTPTETRNAGLSFPELRLKTATALNADSRFAMIEAISNQGMLTLTGDITVVSEDDLHLGSQSGMIVDGDATVVVFDELRIEAGAFIELMPDATLTIFVAGNVTLDNAYIGDERADREKRDITGKSAYMNPERITIFDMGRSIAFTTAGITVAKANIYMPHAAMKLTDQSVVYGRVATSVLLMDKHSAIFYDHALSSGNGYTNPHSALFAADGTLRVDGTSLTSLDDGVLQAVADSLDIQLQSLFGGLLGDGGGGGSVSVGPGDPTPRPVLVSMSYEKYGTDRDSWEVNADGAVVVKVDRTATETDDALSATVKTPGTIVVNR